MQKKNPINWKIFKGYFYSVCETKQRYDEWKINQKINLDWFEMTFNY